MGAVAPEPELKMSNDNKGMTTGDMVKIGVAVVAVVGTLGMGAKIGVEELQKYTAYSHVTAVTAGLMGQNLSKAVLSARSNFVLGATEGVDLGGVSQSRHTIFYAMDDEMGTQYHAAGVSWQKEHQLPKEALRQMSETVLAENEKIEEMQIALTDDIEASFKFRFDAQNMVNIAMFRGMLDGAGELIEIDDRILARTDKYLESVAPDTAVVLAGARTAAAGFFDTEVAGNEKLFAEVQNSLNAFPKENAIFSGKSSRRSLNISMKIDTDENLSRVERVETAPLKLDPVLAGIHEGPDSP